jgi:hypothetical protein
MSVGNLNTEGDKKNNWPWQYKMLKGLQAIVDVLSGTATPVAREFEVDRITGTWTNSLAPIYSISVANVGSATGTVNGTNLKTGEIINLEAGGPNHVFATSFIELDATGTEFLITIVY